MPFSLKSFSYPDNFPNCFDNKSLDLVLRSIMFSFKNGRHVILTGSQGCGKTQIANWISENHSKDQNCDYFCVCTEETRCSDLIGRQKLPETTETGSELIKWENGFLTKAIIEGKCAVLDSLDEAPSTVTERLNGLLDQNYDGKEKMFGIPENPSKNQVQINSNFRLLGTCDIEKISQISPAFLNRFDIVVLEDQLSEINEQSQKDLINILMQRYGS